jgi:hypothetical protein
MTIGPLLLALALSAPRPPSGSAPAQSSPAAAPAEDVRDQVSAYLGAIHEPVPPATFRALGPAAEDALVDFARNDPLPIRRLRALEALAGLGGPRAEAVHREVLSSAAPSAVRRGAVRGLARLSGPSGVTRTLGPVMEGDRDPGVRAAAAEALARSAPAESCGRVRARAKVDADAARFGHALAECDRSERGPAAR